MVDETQTYDISILEEDLDNIAAEEIDDAPVAEIPMPKKRGPKPKAKAGKHNSIISTLFGMIFK